MPQLDASTFTSQLFWLCVSFFMMLFIMSRFIVPKISEILEQRRHRIDGYLEKADFLKQQAETILDEYQKAMKDAARQAEASLAAATREMNELVAERQKELQENLDKKLEKAEQQIAKSREEARREVGKTAEELALLVLERLNINTIEKKAVKQAVELQLKQD